MCFIYFIYLFSLPINIKKIFEILSYIPSRFLKCFFNKLYLSRRNTTLWVFQTITNYLLNCVDSLFTKLPSHVCNVCSFTFGGNIVQISREICVCEIIKFTGNKQCYQDMVSNYIIFNKQAHNIICYIQSNKLKINGK